MSITPIHLPTAPSLSSVEGIRPRESTGPAGVDLGGTFADALQQASKLESSSGDMATRFAGGDPNVGIHEVMIASEEANIALRFTTTLKNKALEAYRELMGTQV